MAADHDGTGRMTPVLRGRRHECDVLGRLAEAVRAGESRALVLRGEVGVGKTALLDYLAGRAAGCRVARAAGVQSEMELAFAGLHQLCAPMLDHLQQLPAPQRDALRTAFGVSAGPVPDRFLVGLAVLSLLSDVAGERPLVVPELAEAAAKTGDLPLVQMLDAWLAERAECLPTDWLLGIQARVRALLATGQAAESGYRESIDRLGRTRVRAQLARGHLLYGEWLRREGRRGPAREQSRVAHEMLDTTGIEAFAERAGRELLATGETARKRTVEVVAELTAQEAQVAGLARDGLSNPQIAARLFISSRTVQYHLGKVFAKLGITSRGQLDQALPGSS